MPRPASLIRDSGGARSGQIFLHHRDVNDKIPVFGNSLKLDTIHSGLCPISNKRSPTTNLFDVLIKSLSELI